MTVTLECFIKFLFKIHKINNSTIIDKSYALKQTASYETEEIVILKKLKHCHVLKYYEDFIDNGTFCIVTEYCEVNFFYFPFFKTFDK